MPDSFVMDNSVVISWSFADEFSEYANSVIDCLDTGYQAVVPSIWPLEALNAMLSAEKRGRITHANVNELLRSFAKLPFTIFELGFDYMATFTLPLARTTGLTIYDACYVSLAIREGLPLATLDDQMRKAAKRMHVHLFKP